MGFKFSDILRWIEGMPPEVRTAISYAVGTDWPKGDEEKLWELAGHWFNLSGELGSVQGDLGATVPNIQNGWTGLSRDKFDERWKAFSEGEEAILPLLVKGSRQMGEAAQKAGSDFQTSKFEIVLELLVLIITILVAIIMAFFSVGTSTAAIPVAQQTARFAIGRIAQALLKNLAMYGKEFVKAFARQMFRNLTRGMTFKGLAKEALEEGIQETLQNMAARSMVATDDRSGISASEALTPDVNSFIGGLIGGAGAHLAGAPFKNSFLKSVFGEAGAELANQLYNFLRYGQAFDLDNLVKNGVAGGVGSAGSGASDVHNALMNNTNTMNALRNALGNLPGFEGGYEPGQVPGGGGLRGALSTIPGLEGLAGSPVAAGDDTGAGDTGGNTGAGDTGGNTDGSQTGAPNTGGSQTATPGADGSQNATPGTDGDQAATPDGGQTASPGTDGAQTAPTVGQPGQGEPAAGAPSVGGEPGSGDPAVASPAVGADSGSGDPAMAAPTVGGEPGSGDPAMAAPTVGGDPGSGDPGMAAPTVGGDPGSGDPGMAAPGADQGFTDPGDTSFAGGDPALDGHLQQPGLPGATQTGSDFAPSAAAGQDLAVDPGAAAELGADLDADVDSDAAQQSPGAEQGAMGPPMSPAQSGMQSPSGAPAAPSSAAPGSAALQGASSRTDQTPSGATDAAPSDATDTAPAVEGEQDIAVPQPPTTDPGQQDDAKKRDRKKDEATPEPDAQPGAETQQDTAPGAEPETPAAAEPTQDAAQRPTAAPDESRDTAPEEGGTPETDQPVAAGSAPAQTQPASQPGKKKGIPWVRKLFGQPDHRLPGRPPSAQVAFLNAARGNGQNRLTPDMVNAVLHAPLDQLSTAELAMRRDYETNLAQRDTDGNLIPDDQGRPQSLDQAALDQRIIDLRQDGHDIAGKTGARKPQNAKFAGQVVAAPDAAKRMQRYDKPLADRLASDGVYFDLRGFPDFSPYARMAVNLPAVDDPNMYDSSDRQQAKQLRDKQRDKDIGAANRMLNRLYGPAAAPLVQHYTWHHVEGSRTMLLVPFDLHEGIKHHGGIGSQASSLPVRQRMSRFTWTDTTSDTTVYNGIDGVVPLNDPSFGVPTDPSSTDVQTRPPSPAADQTQDPDQTQDRDRTEDRDQDQAPPDGSATPAADTDATTDSSSDADLAADFNEGQRRAFLAEVARNIRVAGNRIVITSPGDPLGQVADRIGVPDDMQGVVIHGSNNGFLYNGQMVTPEELAKLLEPHLNGKPIYLVACNAGKGAAQTFADAVGPDTEVHAYTEFAWIYPNGRVESYGAVPDGRGIAPDRARRGSLKVYRAGAESDEAPNSDIGKKLETARKAQSRFLRERERHLEGLRGRELPLLSDQAPLIHAAPDRSLDIDAELARLAELRSQIEEFQNAHPDVRGIKRWHRALQTIENSLKAAQAKPTARSTEDAQKRVAELQHLQMVVRGAHGLDDISEVSAPVRGSSLPATVDLVADGGGLWVNTIEDGATPPGSRDAVLALQQTRAQVQAAALDRRRHVDGRPPRITAVFPNGVDWLLALHLEMMLAVDPRTGQPLPDDAQPQVVVIGERLGTPPRQSAWASDDIAGDPDRPPLDGRLHIPEPRLTHILNGDGTGGGHRPGAGRPGKREFPAGWTDQQIADAIIDVARYPDETPEKNAFGKWEVRGVRNGVAIHATVEPDGRIWAAHPEGGEGVTLNDPYLPEPDKRTISKKKLNEIVRQRHHRPDVDDARNFPDGWRTKEIGAALRDVARNPSRLVPHQPEHNQWLLIGTHNGVTITVHLIPNKTDGTGHIVDAYVGEPEEGSDSHAPERGAGPHGDGDVAGTIRGPAAGEGSPEGDQLPERGRVGGGRSESDRGVAPEPRDDLDERGAGLSGLPGDVSAGLDQLGHRSADPGEDDALAGGPAGDPEPDRTGTGPVAEGDPGAIPEPALAGGDRAADGTSGRGGSGSLVRGGVRPDESAAQEPGADLEPGADGALVDPGRAGSPASPTQGLAGGLTASNDSSGIVAVGGDPDSSTHAAEQRILDGLPESERTALDDAVAAATPVADTVLHDLRVIAGGINQGLPDDQQLSLLGEQHRVKGLASLARKFATEFAPFGVSAEQFLGEVDDLVRFSVQSPSGEHYGTTVSAILAELRARGYEIRTLENYWKQGNSFLGFAAFITTSSGVKVEIQFPTAESWAVGKRTHQLYEVVRLASATPAQRVHALLQNMQVIKEAGLADQLPDLSGLPESEDLNFAGWAQYQPGVITGYAAWLAENGLTFEQVLSRFGLNLSDLPGFDLAVFDVSGSSDVSLPGGVSPGRDGRSDRPDRGGDLGGSAQSGDLGSPRSTVDLQSGGRGPDHVRQPESPEVATDQPSGGAADSAHPGDGTAERGGAASDLRGGIGSDLTAPALPQRAEPRFPMQRAYPKVVLHEHLEGAVEPATLLEIARRNGVALPVDSVEALQQLYEFTDFDHFIEVWCTVTAALRTREDFRQVTLDYARRAAEQGAVYVEGIFSPVGAYQNGIPWQEMFDGYTDAIAEAAEQYGVILRLTPEAYRGAPVELVEELARWSVEYQDRGVVGIGLGGRETVSSASEYASAFQIARQSGLGVVPHAGEAAGPDSIRDALSLDPERIRHGIRAAEDPALLAELARRGTVLDVCPTSNLRTGVVPDPGRHPLRRLIEAGVKVSISTDDSALFGADLQREYELAERLGLDPRRAFEAGIDGALAGDEVREHLRSLADAATWSHESDTAEDGDQPVPAGLMDPSMSRLVTELGGGLDQSAVEERAEVRRAAAAYKLTPTRPGAEGDPDRDLGEAGQRAHELQLRDGPAPDDVNGGRQRLLYGPDGRPFDTRNGQATVDGMAAAMAVLTADGRIIASNQYEPGVFHHPSLVGGSDVAAAVNIVVHDGRIVAISDREVMSYFTFRRFIYQFLATLEDEGVAFDVEAVHFAGSDQQAERDALRLSRPEGAVEPAFLQELDQLPARQRTRELAEPGAVRPEWVAPEGGPAKYGPFHVPASIHLTPETARQIQDSQQITSLAPSAMLFRSVPTVGALEGRLPAGTPGIEFYTDTQPEPASETAPGLVGWGTGRPDTTGPDDSAQIGAVVSRNTVLEPELPSDVRAERADDGGPATVPRYATKELPEVLQRQDIADDTVTDSGDDWTDQRPQAKTFDQQELERRRVLIGRDGKLYNADGNLLDTRLGVSQYSGPGHVIFVMDAAGNIYYSNDGPTADGWIGHVSFLSGGPIAAAGEMRVINGVVQMVSNRSGHYVPEHLYTQQLVERLREAGVPVVGMELEDWSVSGGARLSYVTDRPYGDTVPGAGPLGGIAAALSPEGMFTAPQGIAAALAGLGTDDQAGPQSAVPAELDSAAPIEPESGEEGDATAERPMSDLRQRLDQARPDGHAGGLGAQAAPDTAAPQSVFANAAPQTDEQRQREKLDRVWRNVVDLGDRLILNSKDDGNFARALETPGLDNCVIIYGHGTPNSMECGRDVLSAAEVAELFWRSKVGQRYRAALGRWETSGRRGAAPIPPRVVLHSCYTGNGLDLELARLIRIPVEAPKPPSLVHTGGRSWMTGEVLRLSNGTVVFDIAPDTAWTTAYPDGNRGPSSFAADLRRAWAAETASGTRFGAASAPMAPEDVSWLIAAYEELMQLQARIGRHVMNHPGRVDDLTAWLAELDRQYPEYTTRLEDLTRDSFRDFDRVVAAYNDALDIAENSPDVRGVNALVHGLPRVGPQGEQRDEIRVSVITDGGRRWVISGIHDFTGVQGLEPARVRARRLIDIANNPEYEVDGQAPRLEWRFPLGVNESIAAMLESMGIAVVGPRVPTAPTLQDALQSAQPSAAPAQIPAPEYAVDARSLWAAAGGRSLKQQAIARHIQDRDDLMRIPGSSGHMPTSRELPAPPGHVLVRVDGDGRFATASDGAQTQQLTPSELADLIAGGKAWQAYQRALNQWEATPEAARGAPPATPTIVLFSPYATQGLAQALSGELRAPVIAPDTMTWHEGAVMRIGHPLQYPGGIVRDTSRPAGWWIHYPNGAVRESDLGDYFERAHLRRAMEANRTESASVFAMAELLHRIAQVKTELAQLQRRSPQAAGFTTLQIQLTANAAAIQDELRKGITAGLPTSAATVDRIAYLSKLLTRSVNVRAVNLPVKATLPDGSPYEGTVHLVDDNGRRWATIADDGAFAPGTSAANELQWRIHSQLQAVAGNIAYHDREGRAPRVEWHFPNGIDTRLAVEIERLSVLDPHTGLVVSPTVVGEKLAPQPQTDPAAPPAAAPVPPPFWPTAQGMQSAHQPGEQGDFDAQRREADARQARQSAFEESGQQGRQFRRPSLLSIFPRWVRDRLDFHFTRQQAASVQSGGAGSGGPTAGSSTPTPQPEPDPTTVILGPAAEQLRQAGVDPDQLLSLDVSQRSDPRLRDLVDALRELPSVRQAASWLRAAALRFAATHGGVTTATSPDGAGAHQLDPDEMAVLIRYFAARVTDVAGADRGLTALAQQLDDQSVRDQLLAEMGRRLDEERAAAARIQGQHGFRFWSDTAAAYYATDPYDRIVLLPEAMGGRGLVDPRAVRYHRALSRVMTDPELTTERDLGNGDVEVTRHRISTWQGGRPVTRWGRPVVLTVRTIRDANGVETVQSFTAQPDAELAREIRRNLALPTAEQLAARQRGYDALRALVEVGVIDSVEQRADGGVEVTPHKGRGFRVEFVSPSPDQSQRQERGAPIRITLPDDASDDQAAVTRQLTEITSRRRGRMQRLAGRRRTDTSLLTPDSTGRGRLTQDDLHTIAEIGLLARQLDAATDPAEIGSLQTQFEELIDRSGLNEADPYHQVKRDLVASELRSPLVTELLARHGRPRLHPQILDEIAQAPDGPRRAELIDRFADAVFADALHALVGDPEAGIAAQVQRGPDGSVRLIGHDRGGRLPIAVVNDVRIWLRAQIAAGADLSRLRAEAAAVLGADAAEALGQSRLRGAVMALGQRHADPESDVEAHNAVETVLAEILVDNEVDEATLAGLADSLQALVEQVREAAPELDEIVDEYHDLRYARHAELIEAIRAQLDAAVREGTPDVAALLAEVSDQAQQLIDELSTAAEQLNDRAQARRENAEKESENAEESREKAEKEPDDSDSRTHRDRQSAARRRTAKKAQRQQEAAAARHNRIADRYDAAKKRAEDTVKELQDGLRELERMAAAGDSDPAAVQAVADQLVLNREEYRKALDAATPRGVTWHAGMPTGQLPHLRALTKRVNELLLEHGIDETVTTHELQTALRAEFRVTASPEGVTLRLGKGTVGEVRIKLRLQDAIEVPRPPVRASENMLGQMPQWSSGGRTLGAAASRSVGPSGPIPVTDLIKAGFLDWLPGEFGQMVSEGAKNVAEWVSLKAGVTFNWGNSIGGAGADLARGGAVADNRGDSSEYDISSAWEVQVRTKQTIARNRGRNRNAWTTPETVDSGERGDRPTLKLWVAHPYTEHELTDTTTLMELEPGRKPDTTLAEHVVTGMTGLEELNDRILDLLGPEMSAMGSVARQQVHDLVIEELPVGLANSMSQHGTLRVITHEGEPAALLRLHTEPVLVPVDPNDENAGQVYDADVVGTSSDQYHKERLRVAFSMAGGSSTVKDARGVDYIASPAIEGAPLAGEGVVSPGSSRREGIEVDSTAINPSVQRDSGFTQGYVLTFKVTATVQKLDGKSEPESTDPMDVSGLFRFTEQDAYRMGLPVDSDAVVRRRGKVLRRLDGSVVLRDDPVRRPLRSRHRKLPTWLAENALSGSGVALVQDLTGVDEVKATVQQQLEEQGLIPRTDPATGFPILSKNPMVASAQLLNLREFTSNLTRARLEAGYDEASQGGILLNFVQQRVNHVPEHITVKVELAQHRERARSLGQTDAKKVVHLDIGTDALSRTGGETGTRGAGAKGGVDGDPDNSGTTPAAGAANYKGKFTRIAGWFLSRRVNHVTLIEGTGEVEVIEVPHTIRISQAQPDGSWKTLQERSGAANLVIPADMLPEDGPEHTPKDPDKETSYHVRRRLTLLHMGRGATATQQSAETSLWNTIRQVVPNVSLPGSPGFVHLNQFFDIRSLMSHPEWLWSEYGTDLAVDPRGVSPTRASVRIRARTGASKFLTAASLVLGDINFTMGASGVTTGREWTHGGGAELTGELQTGQDGPDQDKEPDGASGGLTSTGGGSRTTGSSETSMQIYGREHLIIETGLAYVFEMPVTFEVSGYEHRFGVKLKRMPKPVESDGHTVVYALPERIALEMYADGELDLPLRQVADAIERFAGGHLDLDREVSVKLLKKYREELAADLQPDPDLPPADFQTDYDLAENLAKRLVEVFGKKLVPDQLTQPIDQIEHILGLSEQERAGIELPEHLQKAIGQAALEYVDLEQDGKPVDLAEEIMRQVEAVTGNADQRSPGLRQGLSGVFSGRRWLGHLDDMLRTGGFAKSFMVPVGKFFAERVTVRVKAELDDARLIGSTDQVGLIDQVYAYEENSESEYTNKSFAGGASGAYSAGADAAAGYDGGVSSGQGHTGTGSIAQQSARLHRISSFNGVDRIGQRVKITVEVSRTRPFVPRRLRRLLERRRDRRPDRTHTIGGKATRLVPKGVLDLDASPNGAESSASPDPAAQPDPATQGDPGGSPDTGLSPVSTTEPLPDPRTVTLPEMIGVEYHDSGRLKQIIVASLARRRFLGDAMPERQEQVDDLLSALADAATLGRMHSPEGLTLPGLSVPGEPNQIIEITVRADVSDVHEVAPRRDDTELGDVHRMQRTALQASSRNRPLPTGRNIGGSENETGLGLSGKLASGAAASESSSRGAGNRDESSNFEQGTVATVGARTTYHVTIVKKKIDRHRAETVLEREHLPYAARGRATVTLFAHVLDDILARLAKGARRTRWWFSDPEETGRLRRVLQLLARRDAAAPSFDLNELLDRAASRPNFAAEPHAAMADTIREQVGRRRDARNPRVIRIRAGVAPAVDPVRTALLIAGERGADVLLELPQQDGTTLVLRAVPTGRLVSQRPDGGFADALAAVSPDLTEKAIQYGLPLEQIYRDSLHTHETYAEALAEAVAAAVQSQPTPPSVRANLRTGTAPATTPRTPGQRTTPRSPDPDPKPPRTAKHELRLWRRRHYRKGYIISQPAPVDTWFEYFLLVAVRTETPPPPPPPPPPPAPEPPIHVVRPGDTLWDIAERELGDPLRWPEIYKLNRGRPQPGRGVLVDPDLIQPGWELRLPPRANGRIEPEKPPLPKQEPQKPELRTRPVGLLVVEATTNGVRSARWLVSDPHWRVAEGVAAGLSLSESPLRLDRGAAELAADKLGLVLPSEPALHAMMFGG